MKAKGKLISALLILDTFLVSYAVGFNNRRVLVIDPSLPAVVPAAGTAESQERSVPTRAVADKEASAKLAPPAKESAKEPRATKPSAKGSKEK